MVINNFDFQFYFLITHSKQLEKVNLHQLLSIHQYLFPLCIYKVSFEYCILGQLVDEAYPDNDGGGGSFIPAK